ncbi:MAG: hypothetical protein M3163_01855 [Actinomycetota bacterium]|nr:hypothetical protein [Actinomycetota bacterium]
MGAQGEVGDQAVVDGGEANPLEAVRLELSEGELLHGPAPPQREGFAQRRPGRAGPTFGEVTAALRRQSLEIGCVVLARGHSEQIAGRQGQDPLGRRPGRTLRLEQAPQVGDVDGETAGRPARASVLPQHVGEPVDGHHLVGVHEQGGEDGALLRPPDLDRSSPLQNLEWAEEPEMKRRCRNLPRVREDCEPR